MSDVYDAQDAKDMMRIMGIVAVVTNDVVYGQIVILFVGNRHKSGAKQTFANHVKNQTVHVLFLPFTK